MTILDIFKKAAGEAGDVKKVLLLVEARFPDSKPELDAIIALLDTALSPGSLASLVTVAVGELKDVAAGKIDPRKHAGDAI